jgi:uncharacterized protein (TIGR02646 family)
MRHVTRLTLDPQVQADLDDRQVAAYAKRQQGSLDPNAEWRSARQTQSLHAVHATLKHMMDERERCMYCLDSHGTDIEHFWPKTPYPERMFAWLNLLLCCAECGRFKGDRFPLSNDMPLLIDPTAEDPWAYLDFDPGTGNVVARFDPNANKYSDKGNATVELLQLDRREAMAKGYQKTYKRLCRVVEEFLHASEQSANRLIADLRGTDDHGLLGWCLRGAGQNAPPFSRLRLEQPGIWNECVQTLKEE